MNIWLGVYWIGFLLTLLTFREYNKRQPFSFQQFTAAGAALDCMAWPVTWFVCIIGAITEKRDV